MDLHSAVMMTVLVNHLAINCPFLVARPEHRNSNKEDSSIEALSL